MTFVYYAHGSKYVKCNGSHKVEHHKEMAQYCKANFKTNPPRLETKKGESCLYMFKCINCKDEYQANSNTYPF